MNCLEAKSSLVRNSPVTAAARSRDCHQPGRLLISRMPLSKAELSRLRDLSDKKNREAAALFIIEGEKVISELLAAGYPLLEIYATAAWTGRTSHPLAAAPHPTIHLVTEEEMARVSHFPTPSAVLAVGKIARPTLAPGGLAHGLTLALDGIQDPGNVGTMLRLADWFGCARVLLSPDSADLFSQKVINASMGSFARVTVHSVPLVTALQDCPVPVLGCDLVGEDVHTLQPLSDAVIVLGSEGRGLSPGVAGRVTQRVTIPKYGGAESLNAAMAAAIVCDNLRRLTRP